MTQTTQPTTTALYLAKRLVADRGLRPGTVPEAEKLAAAADIVLTRTDGYNLEIFLIIDREADPERRFPRTLETIVPLAQDCLRYCGELNGITLPVFITIWEVGPHAAAPAELTRHKLLTRNKPGLQNVVVRVWALDTISHEVVSTAPFGGMFLGRNALRRLLREPRLPDHEIVAKPTAATQDAGFPYLTVTMLAALALMFVAEQVFAVAPWTGALAPDTVTLIALGGLHHAAIADGEWFRLWTAATLHADIFHLVCNSVALYMGGMVLEGLLGRAWLLALFMLGALGGSLLSYALNDSLVVSVGASGAIMGLLTAALVSSFRLPHGAIRTQLQMALMQMSVPALIPLFTGVDYAAHLGGALTGGLLGLLLLLTWPHETPLPRFRRLAQLLGASGLLILAYGFTHLTSERPEYTALATARALVPKLIPDADLPKSDSDAIARAEQLVADHPDDPRARLANAIRLAQTNDFPAAESNLRHALAQSELLTTFFPDRQLETALRTTLVEVLQAQHKPDAAREAAAPVCTAGPNNTTPTAMRPFNVCP